MSETTEPGRLLREVITARWVVTDVDWADTSPDMRAEWADAERELRERLAAPLDVEARDLHRQLSELRVEAQAQRAGRVEAEHRLGLLVSDAGRRVLAIRSRKLVKKLRKRVAELEAQIAVVTQERDDARALASREMGASDAEGRMYTSLAEVIHDPAVIADMATEDARKSFELACIMIASYLGARQEFHAAPNLVSSIADWPCGHKLTLTLSKPGAESTDALLHAKVGECRDAVTRAEKAERERDEAIKTANVFEGCAVKARGERDRAVTANRLAWKERDEARAEVARLTALLNPRPEPVDLVALAAQARREAGEVETAKPERKPPFVWTDEDRAKLVPGASVVWRNMGTCAPCRRVVSRVRPAAGASGWFVEFTVDGGFLEHCDPLTIEPPATQAEPARPPAPDLRRGDRVTGHSGTEWRVAGSPQWNEAKQRWDVPMSGVLLDMVPAAGLDISTRVRTWQPGEVVPHAPYEVLRNLSGPGGGAHGWAWVRQQPLAEPWTQTGV